MLISGTDPSVPEYAVKEESAEREMESKNYLQQIDEVERTLNAKLIQRKQWFIDEMERNGGDIEVDDRIPGMEALCSPEFVEDEKSIIYEVDRHRDDVGQHLKIEITDTVNERDGDVDDDEHREQRDDSDLCSIHFRKK